MAGLYSHTTRTTGTTLTASIYNTDHQNHINNSVPLQFDDYSSSVAEMQTQTDPGEEGSEVQASTLAGELAALRAIIAEMKGTSYWYQTSPVFTEESNVVAAAAFAGV